MPNLTINGQSYFADAPPDTPLLVGHPGGSEA